jgi:hypothetical protein
MTHESAAHHQLRAEPRLSLDILRSVRSEIGALLGFLQSYPSMEEARNEAQKRKHSAGPAPSRSEWRRAFRRPPSVATIAVAADGSATLYRGIAVYFGHSL